MSLTPGTRVGPYEVTGPIGAGGMGEVYRATDSRLRREVAIKTLPAAFAGDPNRLARFQREAQALAALNNPNIAAIYGVEESAGVTALVMEYVDGPTLADRIAQGPIPLSEALPIARQIGAALEAAHDKGIIHRDLKPANIKVTAEGQVKVLDFGLAKAMDTEATSASASATALANSPTLTLESTRAGVILGTAAYMSPEQARGKTVDKRADIWAFGVVFFEMLTGRGAFEGETVSDTLAGVLRADVDWKLLPADTPPAVRRLLERCLEKDPKRRLRDIGDAWMEIDAPAPAAIAVTPAAPAGTSRAGWWAFAGAALIAIGAVAFAFLHKPPQPLRPVLRSTFSTDQPIAGVSLSSDGSKMAFMEVHGATFTLAVRMLDQLAAKDMPEAGVAVLPVFSPDGQWIAFIGVNGTSAKVEKIPATGGAPVTLCPYSGNGLGLAWSPDGNLYWGGAKGLMRVSSAGGTPQEITKPDAGKHETMHGWPFMMPGNHALLFTIETDAGGEVAVLDLTKQTTRVLVQNGTSARYADGHLIYYRSNTLFAVPFDAGRMAVTGSEVPVVDHVSTVNQDGADYTISNDGLLMYVPGTGSLGGGKTVLNWADRAGHLTPMGEPQIWGAGRLSPDMKRVANSMRMNNTRVNDTDDIWTYDIGRRTPTRLTFMGSAYNPIWTRDGRWITFEATQDGKPGLFRVAADGSGKPELLLPTASAAVPNSWTPDGKTLVFTQRGDDHNTHLWAVAIPGGKPVRLHDSAAPESNGEVSPDGHWLAYESQESGASDVYVQPFPAAGAKTRISTDGGSVPRWAYDGKELFFWKMQGEPQLFSVDVQTGTDFHAGVPQPLFDSLAGTTWDVAADGKRFLVETPIVATGAHNAIAVDNWFQELNRLAPLTR